MQIIFNQNTPFSCGIFLLLSEISKKHQKIYELIKLNNLTSRKKMAVKKRIKLNGLLRGYDMEKKEPLYSQAVHSGLWEGSLIKRHYHPVVKNWFIKLIVGDSIQFIGDVVNDLSTTSFLSRYLGQNWKEKTFNISKKNIRTLDRDMNELNHSTKISRICNNFL